MISVNYLDLNTTELDDAVFLHTSKNLNYKSVRIDVFLLSELAYPEHSYTNLVSRLCERGSRTYPSMRDLNRRFEELFGAYFFSDSMSFAGNSLLHLSLEIIAAEYCLRFSGIDPFTEATRLLFEVLFQPNLNSNGYPEDVVAQEKKNITNDLISVINDKTNYAHRRCIEETVRGTAWSILTSGRAADLEYVDGKKIWSFHQKLVSTCPIHIFVNGNLTKRDVSILQESFLRSLPERQPYKISKNTAIKSRSPRKIFEIQPLYQAKYVVSHYTGPVLDMDQHATLLIFDSLWGGDSHGILYRELREKRGICYYVDSQFDRFSGVIYTIVGCAHSDFSVVSNSIEQALCRLRSEQFSMENLIHSKALIKNRLISAFHDRDLNLRILLSSIITEYNVELDRLSKCVDKVTIGGISLFAKSLTKGVEYFLHDR